MTSGQLGYIKGWIKDQYFDPDTVNKATGDRGFIANQAENIPECLKGNFEDFLYIIQPPTEHVWGLGIAFYLWDDNGTPHLNYRSFLLRPYGGDIEAAFEKGMEPPENAVQGTLVKVGVEVKSDFAIDIKNVPYSWVITREDGTPLMPSKGSGKNDALTFTGDSAAESGVLDFTKDNNNKNCLYASFVMPENCDVMVRFEVNKDGLHPEESNLENNVLEKMIYKVVDDTVIEPVPPTGELRAEDRGAEKYDVALGIPATEELYAKFEADEYLHELLCTPVNDIDTRKITVMKTYIKVWVVPVGEGYMIVTSPETVTMQCDIKRPYQYWLIDKFSLYEVAGARVNNDVLESGGADIEVDDNYYIGPEIVEFKHSEKFEDHVIVDPFKEAMGDGNVLVLPTGYYNGSVLDDNARNLKPEAESRIGQYHVRNDSLIINFRQKGVPEEKTVMTIVQEQSIYRYGGNAPMPGKIPQSPRTHKDALYKKDLMVLKETTNGKHDTTASIIYKKVEKEPNHNPPEYLGLDVPNMNHVMVHTPVVCNSGVRDYISQQIGEKESKRSDIILGEKAELLFKTSEVDHRAIKGYGDRDDLLEDYTKYVEAKYVRFPFDVYIERAPDDYVFVNANTWHQVDKDLKNLFIKVPVWVDEGNYVVNFKTVAINAPDNIDTPDDAAFNDTDPKNDKIGMREYMANKTVDENYVANNTAYAPYVAYRDSNVRVVGQVRNFKVTDINDYPLWESVFRQKKGSSSHTGKNYAAGNALGSNPEPYTLPIMEGSHPTQGDKGALKTGYAFKFELETIGNYFEDKDYIRIKPTFYYVNKNGSGRMKVDIYYNEYFNGKNNILVKIGSDKDKTNKHVITNTDIYRNIPAADIKRTCELRGITDKQFMGKKVDIGTYDEIILTKDLRVFTGNTVSHPFAKGSDEEKRVLKSLQRWYGEYRLPDELYVAPAGTDIANHPESRNGIDGKESFWLKDGYIIVNFSIETHQKASANPVLGYWNTTYTLEGVTKPGFNMWKAEGFEYQQTDHYGKKFDLLSGDVVFYYAGKRSSDDYKVGGNR